MKLILAIAFVWAGVEAQAGPSAPVVVLVPGFFNSLAAGSEGTPYFSKTIIDSLQAQGFETVVVDNLSPLAGIEENGERLLLYLGELVSQPQFAGRALHMIAHSAGGLYAMYALTKMPGLPVQTLATVSTPFEGVGFVERLDQSGSLFRTLVNILNMDRIFELTRPQVNNFLSQVQLPTSLRLMVLGGGQQPCLLMSCVQSSNLSWLLTATDFLTKEFSDGIVTKASAQAASLHLNIPIERPTSPRLNLEHWEQVMDYRFFSLLGVRDIGNIARKQSEFYGALATLIKGGTLDPQSAAGRETTKVQLTQSDIRP
jgi:hypothetical protein